MLLLRNKRKNRVIWKKELKLLRSNPEVFFLSMIRNDLSEFDITGSTLYINRTTAVLKVEKYIIASITASPSPIGCAVVLLVMHVETFKTDVTGLKVVTS